MEEDPLAGHPLLRSVRTLGRSRDHIVVLARNVSTGHLVAVKLIPRGFDSAQAKHLLRELLNHYELTLAKHPHIVGLLDCFLTPRYLATVMEYVDGENLQVFVEKAGGCIIESLARFLFQQLIIALDFCHRKGKVNRNIRPSSLLLHLSDSALPLLRLVDFSASKDTLRNSEPRSQVGTAMYCAPEVLQNFSGAPYDAAAADVWSVGVVLFVVLFGRHPFSRPGDAQLPAQQQILAMFKRLTAPPGSYEGDLFVPHLLPTSSLPGAQPGAPLSLAGADLLRGLLARDPRVRLTLDAVQRHEWFHANLPEGAALLNEVVAQEEAAAGAAAVMPASVAAQLERMVILAAAGPADGLAAPQQELPPGSGGGGDSGGGGGGAGGGGGGGGGSGGQMRPVRDSSGGGAIMYAPTTPQSASQGPTPQSQAPIAVRTVTTNGAYVAGQQQSVSIGSAVAGRQQQLSPVTVPSGGDGAVACGGAAATSSSTGTVPAAASALMEAAHWPYRDPGSTAGVAVGNDRTGGNNEALLADLEAMVMGLPEEDLLAAASLDLLGCPTPRLQSVQGQPPQVHNFHPPQHYLPPSDVSSDVNPAAPLSNETVAGCYTGPSPPQQPNTSLQPTYLAAQAVPVDTIAAQTTASQPDSATAPSRASDAYAVTVPPAVMHGGALQPDGLPSVGGAATDAMDTAPHHPAAAAAAALNQTNHLKNPALYMSLHTAAEAMAVDGNGGGGGLLMRLRTDSLPSPSTLAVVDAQPFIVHGSGSGSGPAGGGSVGGLFSGLFNGGSSYLQQLRDSSLGHIPSTYSMDWCTLSARSEALLSSPKAMGGGGAADGGGGGANGSLVQSSLFHRFCHEAKGAVAGVATEVRDLGRAAVAGLTRRP